MLNGRSRRDGKEIQEKEKVKGTKKGRDYVKSLNCMKRSTLKSGEVEKNGINNRDREKKSKNIESQGG